MRVLKTIKIKPLMYQNTHRLGLYFAMNEELNSIVIGKIGLFFIVILLNSKFKRNIDV